MKCINVFFLFLLVGLVTSFGSGCKLGELLNKNPNDFSSLSEQADRVIETAHSPNWMSSADAATRKAAQEGKLVMALFTGTDWCTWCVKLEEEVFAKPEFREWANENVVPLKLDFPKQTKLPRELAAQNKRLLAKYQSYVKGYPSVLFLDQDGNVVSQMGYARGGPENWVSKAEKKLGWDSESETLVR